MSDDLNLNAGPPLVPPPPEVVLLNALLLAPETPTVYPDTPEIRARLLADAKKAARDSGKPDEWRPVHEQMLEMNRLKGKPGE